MPAPLLTRLLPLVLVLPLLCGPARAEQRQVFTHALSAPVGVATAATTLIDAPPATVAAIAGDPAHFTEIFPAAEVRLLHTQGETLLISVVRKEPWPVGMISWNEIVSRFVAEDGQTIVIDRESQPGSAFFRHMRAILRVSAVPGDPGRSVVDYRVAIEITRWAPLWMLRRSNASAMVATLDRLRQLCEK